MKLSFSSSFQTNNLFSHQESFYKHNINHVFSRNKGTFCTPRHNLNETHLLTAILTGHQRPPRYIKSQSRVCRHHHIRLSRRRIPQLSRFLRRRRQPRSSLLPTLCLIHHKQRGYLWRQSPPSSSRRRSQTSTRRLERRSATQLRQRHPRQRLRRCTTTHIILPRFRLHGIFG